MIRKTTGLATRKPQPVLAMAIAATLLNGCETLGPQAPPLQVLDTRPPPSSGPASTDRFKALENKKDDESAKKTVSELYPATGTTVREPPRTAPAPRRGTGEYTLNFDNTDISEVAKLILQDILHVNYFFNPKVTGGVTLQTTRPLAKEDLLPTLEMVLRANGAALVRDNGVYRVEPAQDAGRIGDVGVAGGRVPAGFRLNVVPLRYVTAAEMQKVLEPLLPANSIVRADPGRNVLLLAGTADDLQRANDTVQIFDVNFLRGMSMAIFQLKNTDAGTMAEELQKILGEGADAPAAGLFRFVPIERMNAVLAVTQQPAYLQDIRNWVERLDRANPQSAGGVRVYRAQNVDALVLADTLNLIFGSGVSARGQGSIAPGLRPTQLRSSLAGGGLSTPGGAGGLGGAAGVPSRAAGGAIGTARGGTGVAGSALGGGVSGIGGGAPGVAGAAAPGGSAGGAPAEDGTRIIADSTNNAVLIVATPEKQEQIDKVIKQLDVTPLQVLIDVAIYEVSLRDELQYGVQWFLNNGVGGGNRVVGGVANGLTGGPAAGTDGTITGSILNAGLNFATNGGLTYGLVNRAGQVRAVINALASKNKINVLSTPSLMVLNNQEAEIRVGDQIPVRTAQSENINATSATTTGLVQTSSIQQLETGVGLFVRPRVNSSGVVLLDVEQSVDTPARTTTSGIDSPTIQQRRVRSSVAVQNGDTLVLGGLIRHEYDKTKSGIPVLHKLPLIGPLFGSTTNNLFSTELVVLITPRVVSSRQDGFSVTEEFKRKLTTLYVDLAAEQRRRPPQVSPAPPR